MRMTSVFSADCPCGLTVEWDAKDNEKLCSACGRLLVVAAWPNAPMMTQGPEPTR